MKKGLVLVFALVVMACGQNKKSDDKLLRGANPRGGAGTTGNNLANNATQALSSGIWGILQPQQGTISRNGQGLSLNANDVSRAFLSTDWPGDIVGATTNQSDANWQPRANLGLTPKVCTAGICEARVTFGVESGEYHQPLQTQSSQTISQIMSSNQRVPITGGGITLGFWDNLVGTTMVDENGETQTLTAIPVYVPVVSQNSYIQGTRIQMTFADEKGSIVADGQVNTSTGIYSGVISFQNKVDQSGSATNMSGQLGSFQVYVCSIFKCQ